MKELPEHLLARCDGCWETANSCACDAEGNMLMFETGDIRHYVSEGMWIHPCGKTYHEQRGDEEAIGLWECYCELCRELRGFVSYFLPIGKPMTLADLDESVKHYEAGMDSLFEHDATLGYITIHASYPYHIKLDRIPNKDALLQWVYHLSGKTWMTRDLLHEFIKRVQKIQGFSVWEKNY